MKISYNTAKEIEPKAIATFENIAKSFSGDILDNDKMVNFYHNPSDGLIAIMNGIPITKLVWKDAWVVEWMC